MIYDSIFPELPTIQKWNKINQLIKFLIHVGTLYYWTLIHIFMFYYVSNIYINSYIITSGSFRCHNVRSCQCPSGSPRARSRNARRCCCCCCCCCCRDRLARRVSTDGRRSLTGFCGCLHLDRGLWRWAGSLFMQGCWQILNWCQHKQAHKLI